MEGAHHIKVYLLYIVVLFFLAEIPLEIRHHSMGYETPIVGNIISVFNNATKKESRINLENKSLEKNASNITYGPNLTFPFKSQVINSDSSLGQRIWIASASHAEGGHYPASEIFPNKICDQISYGASCIVINGSKRGMQIHQNIAMLREHYQEYKPDYVVLYQLSMDLVQHQRALATKLGSGESNESMFDKYWAKITAALQSTSLYVHLTDYIGGNIKLQSQLKDEMPKEMLSRFRNSIGEFLEACEELEVIPVLATFAASHDSNNVDNMHFSLQTNFVRLVVYLSPKGWVNSIEEYNDVIREIAAKKGIGLIDIEKELNGKSQYFDDLVHFNKRGHEFVSQIIGGYFDNVLYSNRGISQ